MPPQGQRSGAPLATDPRYAPYTQPQGRSYSDPPTFNSTNLLEPRNNPAQSPATPSGQPFQLDGTSVPGNSGFNNPMGTNLEPAIHLHVTWGNGAPQRWTGRFSIDQGYFSTLEPLGVEADVPGSMWIEGPQIYIDSHSAKTYNGLQFAIHSPETAVVRLELQAEPLYTLPDQRPAPQVIEFMVSDLFSGVKTLPLDASGNILTVRRSADDLLRITPDRDSLVFSPGEKLGFRINTNRLQVIPGSKIDLLCELRRGRSTEKIWGNEQTVSIGNTNSLRQEIPLPSEEGVYEVVLTAVYNPGLNWRNVTRPMFNWRETLATRSFQCVVISPEAPEREIIEKNDAPPNLELLETIDPSDPQGWHERWRRWTTLPSDIPQIPTRFPSLSESISTIPGGLTSITKLPGQLPNVAQIPENITQLPNNISEFGTRINPVPELKERLSELSSTWKEGTLGSGHLASYDGRDIKDDNATGAGSDEQQPENNELRIMPEIRVNMQLKQLGLVQLKPTGDDQNDLAWQAYTLPIQTPGMPYVLEVEYLDTPQTLGVSILEPNPIGAFVPPYLDFGIDVRKTDFEINTDNSQTPHVKKYRLVFWPQTNSPIILLTNRRKDEPAVFGKIRLYGGWKHLPKAFQKGGIEGRKLAACIDRPLLPENFNASQTRGILSAIGVDDWQTFHEASTRMVEYLGYSGYSGAMISVYSDGSAIYPSRFIESVPVYDTGRFLGDHRDPVEKDVVEMLARLFDRESLEFTPSLDFCSPLPELETALRRGGPSAEGIRWVGVSGQQWLPQPGVNRGRGMYYNILNERVQNAMLNVVREFLFPVQ